ncbi:MAG: transposase [Nitrospirota bacterium]
MSLEARDRYLGVQKYERSPVRADARNGVYERDIVTRLGTVRVPVARTRQRAFLPAGLVRLERRVAEVLLLIREAFLRGLSTRAVGRMVALLTEEAVSAQTVSRLTRDLARPMVCVVNVQSVERIIFSIVNRFNLGWRLRTLRQCTHVA